MVPVHAEFDQDDLGVLGCLRCAVVSSGSVIELNRTPNDLERRSAIVGPDFDDHVIGDCLSAEASSTRLWNGADWPFIVFRCWRE